MDVLSTQARGRRGGVWEDPNLQGGHRQKFRAIGVKWKIHIPPASTALASFLCYASLPIYVSSSLHIPFISLGDSYELLEHRNHGSVCC